MQGVPVSRFSTNEMEADKRYDAFFESMSVIFEVSSLQCPKNQFSAHIETRHLGQVLLVDCMTQGQTFTRSSQLVAQDDLDHYIVQIFYNGHTQRTDGRGESTGRSGNILIIDAARSWKAKNSDFHNLSVVIPRSLIVDLLKSPDGHHGRTIDASNPYFDILLESILELRQSADYLNFEQATQSSLFVVKSLSVALNKATGETASWSAQESLDQLLLKRSLNQYAEDCNLLRLLKKQRLEMAHRWLRSSATRQLSIPQIASAIGYSNTRHFEQDFKKRFGVSPSYARESGLLIESTLDFKERHQWERWFLNL